MKLWVVASIYQKQAKPQWLKSNLNMYLKIKRSLKPLPHPSQCSSSICQHTMITGTPERDKVKTWGTYRAINYKNAFQVLFFSVTLKTRSDNDKQMLHLWRNLMRSRTLSVLKAPPIDYPLVVMENIEKLYRKQWHLGKNDQNTTNKGQMDTVCLWREHNTLRRAQTRIHRVFQLRRHLTLLITKQWTEWETFY